MFVSLFPAPRLPVRNLLQLSLNPTEARYQWDIVECENRYGKTVGYQYELRETEEDVIVAQQQVPGTLVNLLHLTPYTEYSFRVRFVNHVGEGPYSEPHEFRTLSDSKWAD